MGKLIIIVEDSFQLSGRGTAVVPFALPDLIGTGKNGHKSKVRLLRPGETEEIVEATFWWEHFKPGGFRYVCFLENEKKEQLPSGTEIWLLDAE